MGDFDIGAMLKLHNKEHSPAFVVDLALQEKAQDHADWMAKCKKLEHSQSTACADFRWTGENIAQGYPTEKAAMTGWMNSKGHRANIQNKHFTHIGFGCAIDNEGHRWWCVNFGGYN